MFACMSLPGGLWHEGILHRKVMFAPLTGRVEQQMSERAEGAASRPEWVSRVLAVAVEKIGELDMTESIADSLSVGDRVYLMAQLGVSLQGNEAWLAPECTSCHAKFDVLVERLALEVRAAGPTYPQHSVTLGCGGANDGLRLTLGATTGADQRWLCRVRPSDPEAALLERCIRRVEHVSTAESECESVTDDWKGVASLSEDERQALALELERMGPEVMTSLSIACPECGTPQSVSFDPCAWVLSFEELDEEIHLLALHYHWSEDDILRLPRNRRRRYLQFIAGERGQHA